MFRVVVVGWATRGEGEGQGFARAQIYTVLVQRSCLLVTGWSLRRVEGASGSVCTCLCLEAMLAGRHHGMERGGSGVGAMLVRLVAISGPFLLGSLARSSVTVCTTILVGRIGSPVELAAIGFATVMCNITGHSLVQGMGAALDTLSSQAFGAGQVPKLGVLAQRSFAISLCTVCLPASALWITIAPIMTSAGMDPTLAEHVGQFALCRIPGLVTQCLYVSLAKTLNAQRMTKPGVCLHSPQSSAHPRHPRVRFLVTSGLTLCGTRPMLLLAWHASPCRDVLLVDRRPYWAKLHVRWDRVPGSGSRGRGRVCHN